MQYDVKDFLKPKERAAKGDEKFDYLPTLEWKMYWFVAAVTTLKGFKMWTQDLSKGKPLKQTNGQLDVDLTYRS